MNDQPTQNSNIWFVSDTHFNHENIAVNFTLEDGSKARPFSSVEEMNELMIQRWNECVKDQDHVWHLGDVAFGSYQETTKILSRLKGKKRLLLGNHDKIKGDSLTRHFQKVTLWRMFKEHDFICTHVPLRRDQFRKVNFNLHGHTHHHVLPEPYYINLCVEHTNYAPVHLDEILTEIGKRRSHYGPV